MLFRFYAWRFTFNVIDPIEFRSMMPENTFRGAFGYSFRKLACEANCPGADTCRRREECDYARMFEPRLSEGPSGLSDLPRPFVFRAGKVAGKRYPAGTSFSIDIHVFDLRHPAFLVFAAAMTQLEIHGLGPRRSRVRLNSVHTLSTPEQPGPLLLTEQNLLLRNVPLNEVSLLPSDRDCRRIEVRFLTPTEIKDSNAAGPPEFSALFGRTRNRVTNLAAFYGDGPLDVDFRVLKEQAQRVRLVSSDMEYVDAERRSGRTGQRHSLGGWVGRVTYEGALNAFIPWLKAAYWSGVGRQTVWGKGVIAVQVQH